MGPESTRGSIENLRKKLSVSVLTVNILWNNICCEKGTTNAFELN